MNERSLKSVERADSVEAGWHLSTRCLRLAGARWIDTFRALVPSSAVAWALMLTMLIGGSGYFACRRAYQPINAAQILNDSIRREASNLQGQTEHQIVRLEEVSAGGSILQKRVVVLWKDGDGRRFIRRLYAPQENMIAAEWRDGGKADLRTLSRNREAPAVRNSPISQYWDQDLSAQVFAGMGDRMLEVRAIDGGFELTRMGPTHVHPQLVSAVLVLDRNLQPSRQVLRVRVGKEAHELRFEQSNYDRKPSKSVPDTDFNPDGDRSPVLGSNRHSSVARPRIFVGETSAQMAELQIGVLFQLHALRADTGVPIEVLRTADHRVRVSGTVNTDALKEAIYTQLENLDGHERLDLRIVSSRELMVPSGSKRSTFVEAYEVTQPGFAADMRIRGYFRTEGFSGGRLDAAVALFSRDALQHAQRALQHAYALDRLGSSLSADELRTIRPLAQQEWTGMVKSHATGLETELRALHGQLAEIMLTGGEPADANTEVNADGMSIDEPAQYAMRTGRLLEQVRKLNRQAGELFTSSGKTMSATNLNASLQKIMDTIPLQQAEDVAAFAVRLSGQTSAAQTR